MTSAQPGQEQRMEPCPNDAVLDELVKHLAALGMDQQIAAISGLREEYVGLCHDFDRLKDRETQWLNPRPTADLGEDGELERKLRRTSIETVFDDLENSGRRETRSLLVNPDGLEAADRIELYREALERLGSMEAMTSTFARRDNPEGKELLARMELARAVLSRSGG